MPNKSAPASVSLGFASYKDGAFELIVVDLNTYEETTLCGTLKPGQLQLADRILPTCVFVRGEGYKVPEPAEVVQLQPDEDAPGLWVGFKTGADRDAAMKLFTVAKRK